VTLSGRTIAGVIADIRMLGEIVGTAEVRATAERLTRYMEEQLTALRDRTRNRRGDGPPVRALCIEWLDPIFLAGHWVPELVAHAGGVDVGAEPGAHSREVTLEEIDALEFDLVFVMPCGFGIEKTRRELGRVPQLAGWLRRRRVPVLLIDGGAYTSRPGPRLVDAATIMAAAISGGRHEGLQEWM
jgi:iron complex transport system substrate-binding protein